MRLLQLATGPGELIDLHPHVTVVAGLDRTGRELLAEAVAGLASGGRRGPRGLLEAHGVLFDLAPEALALLDIAADGVRPVVTADDLPRLRPVPTPRRRRPPSDPPRRPRRRGGQARPRDADADRPVRRRRRGRRGGREAAAAGSRRPLPTPTVVEALTARPRRRPSGARQAAADGSLALVEAAEAATAARAEVESATDEVRERREAAVGGVRRASPRASTRPAPIATRTPAWRWRRPPPRWRPSRPRSRRPAAQAADEAAVVDDEPPAERLERIDREREALQKRWPPSGPPTRPTWLAGWTQLRATDGGVLVPKAEAVALADELARHRGRAGGHRRRWAAPRGGAGRGPSPARRCSPGPARGRAGRPSSRARPRPRRSARAGPRRPAGRHREGGRPARSAPAPSGGWMRSAPRRARCWPSSTCRPTRTT